MGDETYSDCRTITVKDVARIAGVSPTTVSLSFDASSRISPETREKVCEVARTCGYVPNLAARHLRNRRTRTIGMVVPNLMDPFYVSLIRFAEEILETSGYMLFSTESGWEPEIETRRIERMVRLRVEGLLVCSVEGDGSTALSSLQAPCVLLDTHPEQFAGSWVAADFERAGWLAAKHLLETGCRRPVLIDGPEVLRNYSSLTRLRNAFFSTCAAENVPVDHIMAGFEIPDGRNVADQLLARGAAFDALFCINDRLALGAIDRLEERGRRVGADVAVMGVDNLEVSELSRLSLTTLSMPCRRQAEAAVAALVQQIKHPDTPPFQKFFEPKLIVRNTTQRNQGDGK